MRACAFVKPRRTPLFLAFILAAAVGSILAPAPAGRPASASRAALVWRACGNFECATLNVPLDYANPSGRQVDLALIRQKARDPANRIGSLVENPGGPGVSGVEFLRRWAPALPREIQDRFDIVGFDPRGIGQSAPALSCHDDLQGLVGLDPSPLTPEQWRPVEERAKAFADLCAQRGRDLLPFLGTESVARDLDEIRKALLDQKLTYLGYSYGTVIGQVYADLFPQNVRALVLDGPVDLSLDPEQMVLEQALAFEGALSHFVADCRPKRCLSSSADPTAAVEELLTRAKSAPIPAAGADRPAGAGETTLAILYGLYSDQLWPGLARAVDRALAGDGTLLVRNVDLYLDRNPDGTYDNSFEMNQAVNCLDYAVSRDPARYEALAAQFAAAAPHFGVFNLEGWIECAFWAAPPLPLKAPRAQGAPPILVIGTTGDPATPFKWAQAAAKQLESGVLLTFNGEGHTAYLTGNRCIDDAVNLYLISLRPPAPGTVCGDPALNKPLDVTTSPLPGPSPAAAAPAVEQPNPTAVSAEPPAVSLAQKEIRWDLVAAAVLLVFCVGAALFISLRGRPT